VKELFIKIKNHANIPQRVDLLLTFKKGINTSTRKSKIRNEHNIIPKVVAHMLRDIDVLHVAAAGDLLVDLARQTPPIQHAQQREPRTAQYLPMCGHQVYVATTFDGAAITRSSRTYK
jgi:hypothetical protein